MLCFTASVVLISNTNKSLRTRKPKGIARKNQGKTKIGELYKIKKKGNEKKRNEKLIQQVITSINKFVRAQNEPVCGTMKSLMPTVITVQIEACAHDRVVGKGGLRVG
jgi:hypothetical protein